MRMTKFYFNQNFQACRSHDRPISLILDIYTESTN
jgi:hypothetical protein